MFFKWKRDENEKKTKLSPRKSSRTLEISIAVNYSLIDGPRRADFVIICYNLISRDMCQSIKRDRKKAGPNIFCREIIVASFIPNGAKKLIGGD